MPQEHLDDANVDFLLEQVGCETVPQRLHGCALVDLGHQGGFVMARLNCPAVNGSIGESRKHTPHLAACDLPPHAQALERYRREHRVAIIAALASLHAKRHALAVDIGALARHPH
jgi:hypothetical protein